MKKHYGDLRYASLTLVLLTLSFSMRSVAAPPANVVFVMADDLGWVDVSLDSTTAGNGSDFYETPSLETLAAQGMSFSHAYAAAICAPTRASILTGQYPSRSTNRVFTVGNLNKGNNSGASTLLTGVPNGLPTGEDELPTGALTIAEALRTAGYSTAHFGKFQIGDANDVNGPLGQGFDYNFGGTDIGAGGGGGYHAALAGGQWVFPGDFAGPELDAYAAPYTQEYIDNNISPYSSGSSADALLNTPKHLTDATTDAAIDYMENHKSSPFFVHLSHFAVHIPTGDAQARTDLLAKYQAKDQSDPSQMGHDVPSYAAMVEGVDQSVGRLMDYLGSTPDPRNTGHTLAENTLLVFYSDNGGSESPRGDTDNGPLQGQKGMLQEGGVRVPMVVAMPTLVPAGTVNDTAIASVDFFPTFLDFAQIVPPSPTSYTLDGESMAPLLFDQEASLARESVYWHFPGYDLTNARNQHPQSSLYRQIGEREWKLYYNYEDQEWNLYDLATDLGETNDLAESHPDIIDLLGSDLAGWLDDLDAPLATLSDNANAVILVSDGIAYSNGESSTHDNELLLFSPGDELPLFVSSAPWLVGDFDLNSVVDSDDWRVLSEHLFDNVASLPVNQTILLGDIDGDKRIGAADFDLFKNAYDSARFPGAFEQMLAAPEPAAGTIALAAIVALAAIRTGRRP